MRWRRDAAVAFPEAAWRAYRLASGQHVPIAAIRDHALTREGRAEIASHARVLDALVADGWTNGDVGGWIEAGREPRHVAAAIDAQLRDTTARLLFHRHLDRESRRPRTFARRLLGAARARRGRRVAARSASRGSPGRQPDDDPPLAARPSLAGRPA